MIDKQFYSHHRRITVAILLVASAVLIAVVAGFIGYTLGLRQNTSTSIKTTSGPTTTAGTRATTSMLATSDLTQTAGSTVTISADPQAPALKLAVVHYANGTGSVFYSYNGGNGWQPLSTPKFDTMSIVKDGTVTGSNIASVSWNTVSSPDGYQYSALTYQVTTMTPGGALNGADLAGTYEVIIMARFNAKDQSVAFIDDNFVSGSVVINPKNDRWNLLVDSTHHIGTRLTYETRGPSDISMSVSAQVAP